MFQQCLSLLCIFLHLLEIIVENSVAFDHQLKIDSELNNETDSFAVQQSDLFSMKFSPLKIQKKLNLKLKMLNFLLNFRKLS